MKKIIVYVVFLTVITSCTKLDSFMFNHSVIESYQLDQYDGEVDFVLDDDYLITEENIQLFTLSSGKENTTIYALYIGDINQIQTDTVILYCHGNRDHMDFYWQRAKLLAHTGGKHRYGVLMFDYKGFGMSKGTSTQGGIVEDTEAAIQWLKNKGLSSERLIIYGFSLGSYPATYTAANNHAVLKPSKLILENPFASTSVMVQDAAVIGISNKFFLTVDYDNAEEIKKVNQPFLWMHGKKDDFLNIETHGEVVFKNYNGTYGQAARIDRAGHGSLPNTIGFEAYNELVYHFIKN
jgi:pimeloyl-ACP methyl ester carboxylesterase